MRLLKQSQTTQALLFLMIDSTDHITGKTGLTPTVALSKNGGSFASPSGSVTEVGNGWYQVAGNATDTNTLGPLALHATASGADPVDVEYMVVAFDPLAATNLGLSAIPTAPAGASGGLLIAGSNAATTVDITGTITGNLSGNVGGNVLGSVASVTAGVSLADNAITAAKIASDAITAAKIATSALDNKGNWNVGKTGYALSSAGVQAIWDALTSALTTAGSIGKRIVDRLVGIDGARAVTITVTDDEATAVSAALVRVTQGSETHIKQTNVSGVATFSLDDGSYTLSITKGGYTYTPETIAVSSSATSFTKEMTAVSQPEAEDPTQARCYLTCYTQAGRTDAGAKVQIEQVSAGDAGAWPSDPVIYTADEDGDLVDPEDGEKGIILARDVLYRGKRGAGVHGGGDWTEFTPNAAAFNIPAIIGRDL